MIKILLKLICCAFIFLNLSSCAITSSRQEYDANSGNQYRYLKNDLEKSIRVVWVRTQITNGGHQQALVHIENLHSRSETIRYQFQWFDQLGNPIIQNDLWHYHEIAGNDRAFLTEVAKSSKAYRYQVTFASNSTSVRRKNHENRSEYQYDYIR